MAAPSALSGALGKVRSHGLKYSAVSVVNVVVGQALLFIVVRVLYRTQPEWSISTVNTVGNVFAVCMSAIPAYYLSRAWVWGKRGKSHLTREVLPFWGFAVAGLVLSTITVSVASSLWEAKIVANLANIAAFGVLWVFKFFLLDAFIFGPGRHQPVDDDDEDEDEVVEHPGGAQTPAGDAVSVASVADESGAAASSEPTGRG